MSFTQDLLYAGLSAASGSEIITPEMARARNILPKVISIDQVFEHTYHPVERPLDKQMIEQDRYFDIYVKTLTGMMIVIKVNKKFTIAEVKDEIEKQDNTLPADRQKLVWDSMQLSDDKTIESLGISDGDTIYLVLLLRGGGGPDEGVLQLDPTFLDPNYDFNFIHENDNGEEFWRGQYEGQPLRYYRPYGWYRFAIKVKGKYEDDAWLGDKGIRTQSTRGEWPVSYHGTKKENAPGILQEGFFIGRGDHYGKGVYTSPDLKHVEKWYAKELFNHGGKSYKLVFQNRVNTAPGHLKIKKNAHDSGADYWISKMHNPKAGVIDVRPYGILIKEVKYENSSNSSNCILQ